MKGVINLKSKLLVATMIAAASVPAMAQTAQPDTTDATAYITAGVATILGVFAVKYLIGGVTFVARKVMSAIGR
jgi:hypothetical protein